MARKILSDVDWKWFSFVLLLESIFKSRGFCQDSCDQFIVDFTCKLSDLGLTNSCRTISNCVPVRGWIKEFWIEDFIESVDSEDEKCKEVSEDGIRSKLKLIKDKGKRMARNEIEMRGLYGRRKSTERTNTVLARHPDIRVKVADIGADKWRRTGVYTFSGDTKKEKRMTFKKLHEKLSDHYKELFSYGIVVQLCVSRNKRRKSSKRY